MAFFKEIWGRLWKEKGLQMSYSVFHRTVSTQAETQNKRKPKPHHQLGKKEGKTG